MHAENQRPTSPSNAPGVACGDLVRLLLERPGMTCTEIGETLWPNMKGNRQSMCRPAGKLVARAIKAGLVREKLDIGPKHMRRKFYLTNAQEQQPAPTQDDDN